MKQAIFIGIFISIALLIGAAWAGPQVNPGKWEITTKTKMAGMPQQSMTHTQCVTKDDMVPMGEGANQNCQVKDIRINGNTVSWKITCSGQGGQMDGTGQVTYRGDTMDGTMRMVIKGVDMEVTNHITGRRIGACDGQVSPATSQPAP